MGSATEPYSHRGRCRHCRHHNHLRRNPINGVSSFIQSAASNLSSLISFHAPNSPPLKPSPSKTLHPFISSEYPQQILSLSLSCSPSENSRSDAHSSSSSALKGISSGSASGFPSTVRISSLNSSGKGGPAFIGQVFSMCDLSGTGLMAVSTHFDIPFITKRTPEWVKKIFSVVAKGERNGPVFRFFMDLGDAVSYVRRLNIPSGVVGACRLDLAYEHFKEKPHLFQFVPNEKQVKEANKLLKKMSWKSGKKKIDGVPVFSAQNLDIAVATTDGVKWYTPYFFDKNMLDNILEESVDQHFHSMIQTRNLQRRSDAIDDNLTSEMSEEPGESIWEPPEVQEVLDEVGYPAIPLSAISKAAEVQLFHAVDKVILGNRWLRKAAGIQPKFPYMVESFEERTATSLHRASKLSCSLADSELDCCKHLQQHSSIGQSTEHIEQPEQVQRPSFQFPFADWFRNPCSKQRQNHYNQSERRVEGRAAQELGSSPFLPKITMVGISTGEAGQLSKARLKKTMEDLTRELEQTDEGNAAGTEFKYVDRDPLFVANVGDYYSGVAKSGSARWVRGGIN